MADQLNALTVAAVLQYLVILVVCWILLQLYIDGWSKIRRNTPALDPELSAVFTTRRLAFYQPVCSPPHDCPMGLTLHFFNQAQMEISSVWHFGLWCKQ